MRWFFRALVTLLVLVGLLIVGLFYLPSDRVARLASGQFQQATDRELTIMGSVSPMFWPLIGARVENVSVANAAWSTSGPLLEAEALSIGLDLSALIGGEIKIRQVEVTAPVIRLERASNGQVNWEFTSPNTGSDSNAGSGGGGGIDKITLDKGTIQNGKLIYVDHASGTTETLDALDITLTLPSAGGPADVSFAAMARGAKVSVTAHIEALAQLASGGPVPVALQAGVGRSTLTFTGRAGLEPPVAEGRLISDLSDLAAIASVAGSSAPDLPVGLGHEHVAVEGAVAWTEDQRFLLRSAVIMLDGNQLNGDLDLTTSGDRPKLTASLSGGDLVILPADGESGSDSGTEATGWSTDPIDVSGMNTLDTAVSLKANSLKVGGTTTGPMQVTLTNDRGRAVLEIIKMTAYGGDVSGQFVVNGRSGMSMSGDLKAAGLSMQPLLIDAADYERLVGTGDLKMKFLGSGGSLAEIMTGLSGQGSIAFTDGALIGLDLAGMLRNLDVNYVGEGQKTIFKTITGSYVIDGGVLKNEDLRLSGPLVSATGQGDVGMGSRTLDYRVVPVALADSEGAGGIKVPLLIRGSWDDPEFKLDLEALAKEKLRLNEAELKAKLDAERKKAEEKAKTKAAEALGVTPAEGENLEDAAKRQLQEKALKGLGKLLGGN